MLWQLRRVVNTRQAFQNVERVYEKKFWGEALAGFRFEL